jgi:septal ring factor EnvC (AmiA/AmiB activator)
LIEIFDYCFGSSDFTIPEGVITRNSATYFVVLRVKGTTLLLARQHTDELKNKGYAMELFDDELFDDRQKLAEWEFEIKDFVPLAEFNKAVGMRFGLLFTDVDEDPEARSRRKFNAHAPSPSIRSFTSFMLQHQNLIANKHAIFYRFDQQEKRDQVIEHFKSFVGFAKPEYFQLKQELAEWETKLKRLEAQLPRAEDAKQALLKKVQMALSDYSAASGTPLLSSSPEQLIAKPARAAELVRNTTVQVKGASEENARLRSQLDRELSQAVSKRRDASRKLMTVKQSIEHIQHYRDSAVAVPTPEEAAIAVSRCPFCEAHHSEVEMAANKLDDAIRWLNEELERSSYLPASLAEDEAAIRRDIGVIDREIADIEKRVKNLDQQDTELAKQRPIYEQAVKAKVQVETILERVTEDQPTALKAEIDNLNAQIAERKALLLSDYDV